MGVSNRNFLLSIMAEPSQRFIVRCNFEIDGTEKLINGILDTGCSKTLVSADSIYTEEEIKRLQIEDIKYHLDNGIKFDTAFGVESSPKDYKEPTTLEEALVHKNIGNGYIKAVAFFYRTLW